MPLRILGKTGDKITCIGLGGEVFGPGGAMEAFLLARGKRDDPFHWGDCVMKSAL